MEESKDFSSLTLPTSICSFWLMDLSSSISRLSFSFSEWAFSKRLTISSLLWKLRKVTKTLSLSAWCDLGQLSVLLLEKLHPLLQLGRLGRGLERGRASLNVDDGSLDTVQLCQGQRQLLLSLPDVRQDWHFHVWKRKDGQMTVRWQMTEERCPVQCPLAPLYCVVTAISESASSPLSPPPSGHCTEVSIDFQNNLTAQALFKTRNNQQISALYISRILPKSHVIVSLDWMFDFCSVKVDRLENLTCLDTFLSWVVISYQT